MNTTQHTDIHAREYAPGQVDAYFAYARERYTILLRRRAGEPPPWTTDQILAQYRFCNVFREDDKVTTWVRTHLRPPAVNERDVLTTMVISRWINRISSLERVLDLLQTKNLAAEWPRLESAFFHRWGEQMAAGEPLVGAAYMIKSPTGMTKLPGMLHSISTFCALEPQLWGYYRETLPSQRRLQQACHELTHVPFLGMFLAYEVVTDLQHTALLGRAADRMTWANAGPGGVRGAARLLYNDTRPIPQTLALDVMRDLLQYSQQPDYWPAQWPKWSMREAEHTLCEVDKYQRVARGEGRPKQRYTTESS